MGWVEGFEPSATGTTIRRSTKLSYTHREALTLYGIKPEPDPANRAPPTAPPFSITGPPAASRRRSS
jgi:hypothetical protein